MTQCSCIDGSLKDPSTSTKEAKDKERELKAAEQAAERERKAAEKALEKERKAAKRAAERERKAAERKAEKERKVGKQSFTNGDVKFIRCTGCREEIFARS